MDFLVNTLIKHNNHGTGAITITLLGNILFDFLVNTLTKHNNQHAVAITPNLLFLSVCILFCTKFSNPHFVCNANLKKKNQPAFLYILGLYLGIERVLGHNCDSSGYHNSKEH